MNSSRARYRRYRQDLREHRTEGSRGTAKAHKQRKKGGQRSFGALFHAFWAMTAGMRAGIVLSLTTVTVATALKLIPPAATGFVFDSILGERGLPEWWTRIGWLPTEPKRLLITVSAGVVAIAVLSIVVGITGRYVNTASTMKLKSRVRRRVFAHAIRLPLHRVHELKSGGAASLLREDGGGVGDLLFSMIYNPWRAVIQLAGTLVILAFIDWRLLVGSLAIIPVVFVTHRAWISRIRPIWRDIRAVRQQVDGQSTEAFGGIRVVRGFSRQRTENTRYVANNHFMLRQELLAWWASRSVEVAWAVLIPMATALLLGYGGYRILTDRELLAAGAITLHEALTVGDLVMFLFYLAMLLEPLAMLATSATSFQNNLAALDRILDILAEPTEFAHAPGRQLVTPTEIDGAMTFTGVSFAYPGSDDLVLEDIDLDVPAGHTIALVGPSGSGKTTFCNLVARFYDPTEGTITIDGTNVDDIDVESYRRLLGVVEQDIFLFDGTVGENIAYGRRDATPEEIAEAAGLAHATEFIDRLPDGYDTVIGERGVRLSGGQRQRIAIARALLADPRILILDEATSNLDTESERLIQECLERLLLGRTCFVIAHRLSTIAHADVILVLEHGRVVERGSHAELMEASGRYRRMVQMQFVGDDPATV